MRELTGRRGIRNDVSRYEAVSMVLVDPAENPGRVLETYPRMEVKSGDDQGIHPKNLFSKRLVPAGPDSLRIPTTATKLPAYRISEST
jgi:hypothetical protein